MLLNCVILQIWWPGQWRWIIQSTTLLLLCARAAWKMVNTSPHGWVCACVVAHVLVKSRRRLCGMSVKAALFSCITWNDTQRWHTVRALTHTHGHTRHATRRACQGLPGPRKELVSAHMSHVLFKSRECKGQLLVFFCQVRSVFFRAQRDSGLSHWTTKQVTELIPYSPAEQQQVEWWGTGIVLALRILCMSPPFKHPFSISELWLVQYQWLPRTGLYCLVEHDFFCCCLICSQGPVGLCLSIGGGIGWSSSTAVSLLTRRNWFCSDVFHLQCHKSLNTIHFVKNLTVVGNILIHFRKKLECTYIWGC